MVRSSLSIVSTARQYSSIVIGGYPSHGVHHRDWSVLITRKHDEQGCKSLEKAGGS